jgi:hypothetical protein
MVLAAAAMATTLATAAVVLLFVGSPSPDLPAYTLKWKGGIRSQRTAADAAGDPSVPKLAVPQLAVPQLAVDPALRFTLVLRSDEVVSEPLGVRIFAVREESPTLPADHQQDLWEWEEAMDHAKIAASGALRITGTGVDLDLPPGDWTLLVALGRIDTLPGGEQVRARWQGGETGVVDRHGWQLLSQRLQIVAVP